MVSKWKTVQMYTTTLYHLCSIGYNTVVVMPTGARIVRVAETVVNIFTTLVC